MYGGTHSGKKMLPLLVCLIFIGCICSNCASAMPVNKPPSDTLNKRISYLDRKITQPIDSILVVKHFRHMYVFNNKKLLKIYNISLGQEPVGAKHFKGDLKTPEGLYRIFDKNPYSSCHKNLGISYPNEEDRRYARSHGKPTGGDVKIHGLLNGEEDNAAAYEGTDWTWGCIAVTNADIDELYQHVKLGSPILILP